MGGGGNGVRKLIKRNHINSKKKKKEKTYKGVPKMLIRIVFRNNEMKIIYLIAAFIYLY